MKYLLSIYLNPSIMDALTEAERDEIMEGAGRFVEYLASTGELVTTHALAEPDQSAVVRVRGGVPAVTDGPYLEAKEFLAGYYVVDCESVERACEIAAMMPESKAPFNGVEVRPLMEDAGLEM